MMKLLNAPQIFRKTNSIITRPDQQCNVRAFLVKRSIPEKANIGLYSVNRPEWVSEIKLLFQSC